MSKYLPDTHIFTPDVNPFVKHTKR